MTTIRMYAEEDYPTVLDLSKEFFRNSIYKEAEMNEPFISSFLSSCIQPSDEYVALVALDESKIVGVLCAFRSDMYTIKGTMTSELFYYVDPNYKKTRTGYNLLQSYAYWSKDIAKADYCKFGVLSDGSVKKLGFTLTEQAYIKRNI